MKQRIDGAMTSVSFNYLPDTDDILCVYDHGGIFPDKRSPNSYTVLTHFFVIPANDPELRKTPKPETLDLEIPLSDFLFFGCGSWFKRKMHRGRSKLHKITNFSNLITTGLLDAFVDGPLFRIYSEREFGMDNIVMSLRGGPYLSSKKGKKLVFKDSTEIFRFFVCGLSDYAKALIDQLAEDSIDEPAFYEDETKQLDEDTFVIAPSPRFSDPAIAIQLALIISSTDLRVMFGGLARVIKRTQIGNKGMTPELVFPERSISLSATFRDTYPHYADHVTHIRQITSPSNRCMMIGQILSDNREIPFKKLIIKSPNYKYDYILNTESDSDESGNGKTIEEIITGGLNSNHSNSSNRNRRVRTLTGIAQAFPQLSKVRVTIDREVKKAYKVPKIDTERIRRKYDPEENSDRVLPFSTGDGGFSGNADPLSHLPKLNKRQKFGGTTFSPGKRRLLFSPQAKRSNLVEIPLVEIEHRDERIPTLVEASHVFRQTQHFNQIQIEAVKGYRATGELKLGAKEARWMAVVFLRVGPLSAVWIEPVRINKEAICLGIVIRLDGKEIGAVGLRNILIHCGNRIRLRGKERLGRDAFSGIWPTDFEFDDAIGSRLWHSPKRKNPDFLADDLYEESISISNIKIRS